MSIWGRGTGNGGEWEALTQGTQGIKRKICRSLSTASFIPVFPLNVEGKLYDFDKIKWGQSVAWLIFGKIFPTWHWSAFSICAFPFSPSLPTHTRVEGKQTMIYGFQRVQIERLISPASAPLPNLKASSERTKNQLSNACLRSRNGGVGAEICLRKVRQFGWQGGDPYRRQVSKKYLYCF